MTPRERENKVRGKPGPAAVAPKLRAATKRRATPVSRTSRMNGGKDGQRGT